MEDAYCQTNGQSYDIVSFSKLEPALLNSIRHSLVCNICQGKAYYSKKSRNGKPAHFGAYHLNDCLHQSKNTTPRIDPQTVDEVNAILTNDNSVEVNFTAYNVSDLAATPHTTRKIKASSRQSTHHTRPAKQFKNATKGLRSLLRMLMHTDSFATSNIDIHTGGKHPYKAKNLFVNFDDIEEEHIGKWRGFYGLISHADEPMHWLNIANKNKVSIATSEIADYFKNFDVQHHDDLIGAEVLVFGYANIAKSGKWYIKTRANNPAHIFINLTP